MLTLENKLTVTIGELQDNGCKINLSLVINPDGTGIVCIYSGQIGKDRAAWMPLDATGYAELRRLFAKLDATIADLKRTGQLKYVVEGFDLLKGDQCSVDHS